LKISNYLLIAGGKASLSLAMVAPRPADHNLKAAGSNPAPATKFLSKDQQLPSYRWREDFIFRTIT
ncbi:hypothetical protein, partial [Rhizobium beringeri]|uniref:hypothetical protein n=1 Tax=Rhizobium beringeri TaxID=3019934 RepID=UPI003CF402FE